MIGSMNDVRLPKRIHVMNDQTNMNLVTDHSKIARIVSDNDVSTKLTPLSRLIELLIDPSVEAEGLMTDFALQSKVFESLVE